MPEPLPRSRVAAVAALIGALGVVGVALAATIADDKGDARSVTQSSTSTPLTDPGPTTTTTIVVQHVELPAGTREYATARPDRSTIRVRRTPPARWDRSLSPVVTPTGAEPPRSGKDQTREALPNESVPITGRRVTEQGWVFDNPGGYEPPQPLRFGVVQRQGRWLEVQLPVRPNGTTGWIHDSVVEVASTTLSIQISLTERRLRLIDQGAVLLDAPVGIGRPSTPTPTGRFTVTDVVPSANPAGGYGPVALALDGYSEALDRFGTGTGSTGPDSGVPVLAVHGTNRPASVGQAQSNGCPRLLNDDIVRLAALAPAGTPVQIWP
ncbi:MAG: L,D-transpeptidase [Microthrixaceae bacterium]